MIAARSCLVVAFVHSAFFITRVVSARPRLWRAQPSEKSYYPASSLETVSSSYYPRGSSPFTVRCSPILILFELDQTTIRRILLIWFSPRFRQIPYTTCLYSNIRFIRLDVRSNLWFQAFDVPVWQEGIHPYLLFIVTIFTTLHLSSICCC